MEQSALRPFLKKKHLQDSALVEDSLFLVQKITALFHTFMPR